ncbi:hypothetical protein [Arthrobacter sp. JSM 101049]|uniref:hypothetical protein n=1 Tax=Arthrobacter sp. JSM 101049 TaxID=929097 RepID=UPI00356A07CC
MQSVSGYFLLLDSRTEALTSKFITTGIDHRGKSLNSGETNWNEITRMAKSKNCLGVIAVLREHAYQCFASDRRNGEDDRQPPLGTISQVVIDGMLAAIAAQPHLVLIHEAVLGGAAIHEGVEVESDEDASYDEWSDKAARDHFGDIDEHVRLRANERLSEAGINTTPYRRNADASMLSLGFIEDQQSNLLFRLYVPAGRLYENESADLLRLFHEWLTSVRGMNVRQGGYTTARGRVIEFFAENRSDASGLHGEMQRFQAFLALVEHPLEAEQLLVGMGVNLQRASSIVSQYAKRARRLQIDVKHERERRSLDIRQQLESELLDEIPSQSGTAISQVVDMLLPNEPQLLEAPARRHLSAAPYLIINQQFITRAEGIIAQNIAGDAIQGKQANELQALIAHHADTAEQGDLLNSLREFLDGSAPVNGRLKAKQRLKGFLLSIGDKAGQVGVNLLQAWIEKQLGL